LLARKWMNDVSPIDVLTVEHEVVRRYAQTLEAAARCLRRGDVVPGSFFTGMLALSARFIEDFHHVKEEHRLFPRLVTRHRTELLEHVQILARQHLEGHARVEAIERATVSYLAGEADGREILAGQIEGYADLLGRHLHREDNVFFPLARTELDEDEQREMTLAFRREEERFPPDFLRQVIRDLHDLRATLHELSQVRLRSLG
jgi:hemerythrin-like domain-containing protein